MNWNDLESRLDAAIFASPLAQVATLRGQSLRIVLDHNVQIDGDYGQLPVTISVAEFPRGVIPTQGDDIYVHAESRSYILDSHLAGRPDRWIVRPAT